MAIEDNIYTIKDIQWWQLTKPDSPPPTVYVGWEGGSNKIDLKGFHDMIETGDIAMMRSKKELDAEAAAQAAKEATEAVAKAAEEQKEEAEKQAAIAAQKAKEAAQAKAKADVEAEKQAAQNTRNCRKIDWRVG